MTGTSIRRASGRLIFLLAAVALVAQSLVAASLPVAAGPKFKTGDGKAEAIVELAPGSDPALAAAALGVTPRHVYTGVISGFAADLPPDAVARLRSDRRVKSLSPDGKVRIQGRRVGPEVAADAAAKTQRASTGVGRIGTVLPKKEFDIDVAIVDTGVGPSADLNIAGGYSCLKPDQVGSQKKGKGKGGAGGKGGPSGPGVPDYSDGESHGTHVAGIVAAINNKDGVVGVAPGARIWAVRVLGSNGTGKWSDVVCGMDWVYENRATIEIVNMSLAGNGSDSGKCSDMPIHKAICMLVNKAGIPVVVAAGNQSKLASTRIPAAYSEVIAVSAFSDSDGAPGGFGGQSCEYYPDDSFWGSSNYGPAVDVAAPGDCILSITPRGLARYSGTSMATPLVTAAIARYLTVVNPSATPAQVRAWLQSEGSRAQTAFEGFTGGKSEERALWLGPAPVVASSQRP